jgi:hypothetical protein
MMKTGGANPASERMLAAKMNEIRSSKWMLVIRMLGMLRMKLGRQSI